MFTKNQQEIGSNLLIKIFMALLIKKATKNKVFIQIFLSLLMKKQEIGSNLLIKIMALFTKNHQEIGSDLLMKIFMALLTKNQ